MRRREFIAGLVGTAAWPSGVLAQQPERMPLVGVLMGTTDNAEVRSRVTAFLQAFQELGWTEGRTVQIDLRWGGRSSESIATQARELTQLKPDVIFAGPTNALIPLQKETRIIPIVFVTVSDPLEQGFVQSLARPNGNITGFSNLEYSLIGKWLQLLKEAAPGLTQVGLMISTMNASSPKWYQMFKAVAPTLAIEPIDVPIRNDAEIEPTIKSLASRPNSALIVAGDTLVEAPAARQTIIDLTAKHQLPALYRPVVRAGRWAISVRDRSDRSLSACG